MYCPKSETNDIVPTPATKPVITRITLVLSRFVMCWRKPSKYVGNTIKIAHKTGISHKLKRKIGMEK